MSNILCLSFGDKIIVLLKWYHGVMSSWLICKLSVCLCLISLSLSLSLPSPLCTPPSLKAPFTSFPLALKTDDIVIVSQFLSGAVQYMYSTQPIVIRISYRIMILGYLILLDSWHPTLCMKHCIDSIYLHNCTCIHVHSHLTSVQNTVGRGMDQEHVTLTPHPPPHTHTHTQVI